MIFEEMMQDERNQGRAEGKREFLLEILTVKGFLTEEIKAEIVKMDTSSVLNELFQKALESDSKEAFLEKTKELSVF